MRNRGGRKIASAGGRHFVYVMTCSSGGKIIAKVGLSHHPEKRLREIQAASPLKLTGFYTAEIAMRWRAFAAEQAIHFKLSRFRDHGEWFYFHPEAIDSLFCVVDEVLEPYGATLEKVML